MIPRTPVLYVRHSALDSVDPDDVDGLREVWSSFSGAKNSINQGTRLEYLSWRLYTRGILQKHRKKQENLEIPPLVDPPALEMSSSTESITKGNSSNRLTTLFDRICTNPATPEEPLKLQKTEQLVGPAPSPVQVTPVTTPTMEVVPPSPREGIAIERPVVPVVCGFDRVSVSNRSSVSLNQQAGTTTSPPAPLTSAVAPSGRGMFFIESSSDSEPEQDHVSRVDDDIPVPVPTRPGLVRRKTVTFEEPKSFTDTHPETEPEPEKAESERSEDEDDEEHEANEKTSSDDYEDVSDGSDWGDSEWDDLSDEDEPMFSGRNVPQQPQQRRSLLSSMFAGAGLQRVATPENQESHIPSPDSVPRTTTSEVGSAPYLGRVESQSSLFESAMRGKGTDVEQIILNNNLKSHIPIPDKSGSLLGSTQSDEIMERELSQSIRSNLSHKRLYDIDVLWGGQRAHTSASQRRPTLSRSTTMPAPPMRAHSSNDDDDIQDSQSYHTRGW